VMTQAGFEAQGFVSMFEKLQQASRLNDSGAYPYLRSHPLTTERIADMQGRQPLGVGNGPSAPPTLEHAIMTARARVLSNPGVDALRAIAAEAVDNALTNLPPVRQVEVLYGATLSASRLREFSSATQSLTRLAARVQGDARATLLSHWLGVEVALAAGENNRAAALLDQVAASPDLSLRRPQLFLRAQAALQSGDVSHANEVAQDFQIWVLAHPRDATAWQSLSSLYALQGQSLRSIRADAEAQVARLDYTAALERFRAAQELMHRNEAAGAGSTGQDHIESSIVDTRKRQVELLLKEQSLDR
ncbi:MAG: peptidase M48, partial [Comamonadaceae bacterium]